MLNMEKCYRNKIIITATCDENKGVLLLFNLLFCQHTDTLKLKWKIHKTLRVTADVNSEETKTKRANQIF